MLLTGEQIVKADIVYPMLNYKQDDGTIPSYGCDGMLYTLRGAVDWTHYVLEPLQSVIFRTLEHIVMPTNCGGLLTIKSTYARLGIILVTNSPVDPGYRGTLMIRLFNSSDEPVMLQGAGGFMQMTVHLLNEKVIAYSGRWQDAEQTSQ